MLVWLDGKKIVAYNSIISQDGAQQYISTSCLLVDGLDIEIPLVLENQAVEIYLNDDLSVRY